MRLGFRRPTVAALTITIGAAAIAAAVLARPTAPQAATMSRTTPAVVDVGSAGTPAVEDDLRAASALPTPSDPVPSPEDASILASLPPKATWLAEVTTVAKTAKSYLSTRLASSPAKTAVVFDIDNTSLATTYSPAVFIPAIEPTLELAKQAKAKGAAVFFVTARPKIFSAWSKSNLSKAGFSYDGLYMRSTLNFSGEKDLKTKARTAIEGRGYTIVANVGNRTTDLEGGHAERTFKYPDYNGKLT